MVERFKWNEQKHDSEDHRIHVINDSDVTVTKDDIVYINQFNRVDYIVKNGVHYMVGET